MVGPDDKGTMRTLKWDEIPDEGLWLEWREEVPSLSTYLRTLAQIDFQFKTPLDSKARIVKAGKAVLIKGSVETLLELRCIRCLKAFPFPLTSSFDITLLPLQEAPKEEEVELAEEDMASDFFEGGEIHLSELACEQVFLEIPVQPLCQRDCKGLCPGCGKDLNLGPCGCQRETFETGFAVLRKWKLDS